MPAITLSDLGLDAKTPSDLEARRREIIAQLSSDYKGVEDPEVPMELLNELAVITGSLRRKNAGPPKVSKPSKLSAKTTTSDFVV